MNSIRSTLRKIKRQQKCKQRSPHRYIRPKQSAGSLQEPKILVLVLEFPVHRCDSINFETGTLHCNEAEHSAFFHNNNPGDEP